ncbi:MAG: efflux RND transporter periplasmic adaptor subunit [Candidatus Hydrogenedentota bacterium]
MTIHKSRMDILATVALAVIFSLGVCGCGGTEGNGRPGKQPPLVEVETIERGDISHTLDLSAEVVAIQSIQVSATVEGPIDFFPWHEGDTVEAGEKLIEISRETYRAEKQAAEAALKVAQSKLTDLRAGTRSEEIDKARESVKEAEQNAAFEQADLGRTIQLVESGALAGEERDRVRVRHAEAQAKLATARRHLDMLKAGPTKTTTAVQEATVEEAAARLALARAKLAECIIHAPFAGTITDTFVRRGDMASARTPLLAMADLNDLVLRFAVPEAHAAAVEAGMALSFMLDAAPDETFTAEIVRVYPKLNAQMRTRTVEAELPTMNRAAANMFARVRLTLAREEDATLLPAESVNTTPSGDTFVFVVAEGKARRREVEIGIEQGKQMQAQSGVEAGERVVVAGQGALKDGRRVRLPDDSSSNGGKGSGGTPAPSSGNGKRGRS